LRRIVGSVLVVHQAQRLVEVASLECCKNVPAVSSVAAMLRAQRDVRTIGVALRAESFYLLSVEVG
jgi:hypothetical protein